MVLPDNLNAVQEFKKTTFYKEFVEKVYICNKMPNTVQFKAKKPYHKRDEIILWKELEYTDIDTINVTFKTSEILIEVQ